MNTGNTPPPAAGSPRAWLLAARPKTLPAAAAPVVLGAGLAASANAPMLPWLPLIFLSALLLQTGANLANDYWDARKGADTPGERLGPARATSAGLLPPRAVLSGTVAALGLAAACGLPLVLHGGMPILLIGLASIAAAVLYTAGPFPIAYLGLGDLFALVFFGLIPTAGTAFLLSGNWMPESWAWGLLPGCTAVALITINNLRDRNNDALCGKKTTAVRFGERFARAEISVSMLLPAVILFFLLPGRFTTRAFVALVAVLLALPTMIPILRGCDGRPLNALLPRASLAGLLLCTLAALIVSIVPDR